MVGDDVAGVGGSDLEQVTAAYVIGVFGLVDRGFEQVLVEKSWCADPEMIFTGVLATKPDLDCGLPPPVSDPAQNS